MPVEQNIHQRLAADPVILANIAMYGGQPAIFENMAPFDTAPGWQGLPQYPRIVYIFDRSNTLSNILTGTLHLQVWGRQDKLIEWDAVVQESIVSLDDSAHATADDGLVVLNWQQANKFNAAPDSDVFGVDLVYQARAFDSTTTYPPDPIASLARVATTYFDPRIKVTPASWSPADDTPALYFRTVSRSSTNNDQTNWGFWTNVRIEAQVLAPSVYARGVWVRMIADLFRTPKFRYVGLEDASAMRILNVAEDLNTNPYSRGQIQIDARYGVLQPEAPVVLVNPPLPPPVQIPGHPAPPPQPPLVNPPGQTTGGNNPPPPDVPTDTGQKINHAYDRLVPEQQ